MTWLQLIVDIRLVHYILMLVWRFFALWWEDKNFFRYSRIS